MSFLLVKGVISHHERGPGRLVLFHLWLVGLINLFIMTLLIIIVGIE